MVNDALRAVQPISISSKIFLILVHAVATHPEMSFHAAFQKLRNPSKWFHRYMNPAASPATAPMMARMGHVAASVAAAQFHVATVSITIAPRTTAPATMPNVMSMSLLPASLFAKTANPAATFVSAGRNWVPSWIATDPRAPFDSDNCWLKVF